MDMLIPASLPSTIARIADAFRCETHEAVSDMRPATEPDRRRILCDRSRFVDGV